jgi:DNA-binding transcriptional LysR family regulator
MMEHRQLGNFLVVCEEKSISKAAERLFISQQGLSKLIKQLEQDLQVPLFFRGPRGIELTEFGEALQKAARPYVHQHDHIIESIRQLKEKAKAHLSIGIASGSGDFLPPGFFSAFIAGSPDIDVTIQSFPDDTCQESILDHKIHLGFSPAPIDTTLFDSVYYERRKLYLVVGRKHRFARRASIRMADLRDESIITLNSTTNPQGPLADICARHGVELKIFLTASENGLVRELCNTHRIVSFFAGPRDQFADLVPVDIEDLDLYLEFHLIVNKHAYIGAAPHRFIAYTRETLQGRP